MIKTKIVQKFGNGGHIVLPKEYIGKKVKFIVEPKTFENIKSDILEILKPYLENILGIYLYGSYARNEQSINSDVDILVITNDKIKIIKKVNDYSIVSITLDEIEGILDNNAILVLPIIKEAKTIINPRVLEKYKKYRFTKKNTKSFIAESAKILELNRKGLELGFEVGSLVYSLILRIRGLLMIKLMLDNRLYSKEALFSYLEDNGLSGGKIEELYRVYANEREDIKIKKSDEVSEVDIGRLLIIAEKLLGEDFVKMSKKKYKKGVKSLKKEIEIHRDIKLKQALEDRNLELAGYYEKEIKRLEGQLIEKEKKLLPRIKRIKRQK